MAVSLAEQFKALTLRERVAFCLREHTPAVELFLAWREVLHLWDDLIDRDRAVPDDDVHSAMFAALVLIPGNSFFREHQDSLLPVLVNAVANWRAANEFERGDNQRLLSLAYVIRSDYANLLLQLAFLVGGQEWLFKVTPLIRDTWTDEDFQAYLNNLAAEKSAGWRG